MFEHESWLISHWLQEDSICWVSAHHWKESSQSHRPILSQRPLHPPQLWRVSSRAALPMWQSLQSRRCIHLSSRHSQARLYELCWILSPFQSKERMFLNEQCLSDRLPEAQRQLCHLTRRLFLVRLRWKMTLYLLQICSGLYWDWWRVATAQTPTTSPLSS